MFLRTIDFSPVPAVRSPLIRRPRRAIRLGGARTRGTKCYYTVCNSYADHAYLCFHVWTDALKLKRLLRSERYRNVNLFGPAFGYLSAGACSGNLNGGYWIVIKPITNRCNRGQCYQYPAQIVLLHPPLRNFNQYLYYKCTLCIPNW